MTHLMMTIFVKSDDHTSDMQHVESSKHSDKTGNVGRFYRVPRTDEDDARGGVDGLLKQLPHLRLRLPCRAYEELIFVTTVCWNRFQIRACSPVAVPVHTACTAVALAAVYCAHLAGSLEARVCGPNSYAALDQVRWHV